MQTGPEHHECFPCCRHFFLLTSADATESEHDLIKEIKNFVITFLKTRYLSGGPGKHGSEEVPQEMGKEAIVGHISRSTVH